MSSNPETQRIDMIYDKVLRHSASNLNSTWKDPMYVANTVKTMRDLQTTNKDKNEELKRIESLLEPYASVDPEKLTPEDREKINKLYNKKKAAEAVIKNNNLQYNKLHEEAKEYVHIGHDRNGLPYAQMRVPDSENPGKMTLVKIKEPSQLQRYKDANGNIIAEPNIQYQWTDTQADGIRTIIEKFKAGETVDNDAFSALLISNYNVQGDPFNILTHDMVDIRFKYNIKRNFNEHLVDIRNIKNFRSSNIHNEENKLDTPYEQNFVNPTTIDGTNASKSFYMSRNDFYWSLNYNDIQDLNERIEKQSIQNIILNEYQPRLQYNIGQQLFKILDQKSGEKLDKESEKMLKKAGMTGLQDWIGLGALKAVEWFYNNRLDSMGKHPEKLYNEENYESPMNPMYYVEHLFNDGTWLNTYELPFLDNGQVKTDYLRNSADPGTWDIGGLTDDLGLLSITQRVLHDRISLSLPTSPSFNLNNPHNAAIPPFKISFYLINKDDAYLDKNFQFMQALFAGTQWLAMELGAIVATNVYHVQVPGRFIIQWAAMESEFQAIGKLRTNEHMYAMHGQKVKMIEWDTLWPEAWSVTLNIKPLTPWNFNTHMAYYLHGFGAAQRTRLATMKSAWWNTVIGLENLKNQIVEQLKRSSKIVNEIQKHAGAINDKLKEIDDLEEQRRNIPLYKTVMGVNVKKSQEEIDAEKAALEARITKLKGEISGDYKTLEKNWELFEDLEDDMVEAMVAAGFGDEATLRSQTVTDQIKDATMSAVGSTIRSRSLKWDTDDEVGKELRFAGLNDELVVEELEAQIEGRANNTGAVVYNGTNYDVKRWEDRSWKEKYHEANGRVLDHDEQTETAGYIMSDQPMRNIELAHDESRITDSEYERLSKKYLYASVDNNIEQRRKQALDDATKGHGDDLTRARLTLEINEKFDQERDAAHAKIDHAHEYKAATGRRLIDDQTSDTVGFTDQLIRAKNARLQQLEEQRMSHIKASGDAEYHSRELSEADVRVAETEKQIAQLKYEYAVESINRDTSLTQAQRAERLTDLKTKRDDEIDTINLRMSSNLDTNLGIDLMNKQIKVQENKVNLYTKEGRSADKVQAEVDKLASMKAERLQKVQLKSDIQSGVVKQQEKAAQEKANYRTAVETIANNPNLSVEEKRQQISALRKQRLANNAQPGDL